MADAPILIRGWRAGEAQDQNVRELGRRFEPTSNREESMALHTVRAAAEQLGVAYSTLKRWVLTGHVRTSRTEGGHHRISDNEIDRLLARQQPERRARGTVTDDDDSLEGLSA